MKRWPGALIFIFGVVGIGFLLGYSNLPGVWYQELSKPPFTPPNWLFAPAWTVLYVLIGFAGWRTFARSAAEPVFGLWLLQMSFNFLWSPVVFGIHELGLGLIVILGALVAILAFIMVSWTRDRISALCFVPYVLWVGFASYLNAGLYLLN